MIFIQGMRAGKTALTKEFENISIEQQEKRLMERYKEEEELKEKINSSLGVSKECLNTKSDSAATIKASEEEYISKILNKDRRRTNSIKSSPIS